MKMNRAVKLGFLYRKRGFENGRKEKETQEKKSGEWEVNATQEWFVARARLHR
jgi:hypothetical protein